MFWFFFLSARWKGLEQGGGAQRRKQSHSATTTTAACGRNREELLGQRSDFSKPCQGAAEKSANATRCCCLARGSQPIGMSTVEAVDRKISWLFCFVSHGCTVFARWVFSMSDDVGRCIALQSVPFFAAAPCLAAAADSSHVPVGFILPGCAPLHTCRKFTPVKLPKIRPEKFT